MKSNSYKTGLEIMAEKVGVTAKELGALYVWLEELGCAGIKGAEAGKSVREALEELRGEKKNVK